MRIFKLLSLLPMFLFAQSYLEASGQTRAFTLAAGSTSTWEPPMAVQQSSPGLVTGDMTLYPNPAHAGAVIRVQVGQGRATVTLYNVAGKKVQSLDFSRRTSAVIATGFPNGIYFARLAVNGKTVRSTRFLVVR